MDGLFVSLAEWVMDVISSLGYLGLAALVALENLFPPIPSEVILPLAGFLAAEGVFRLPIVVVMATLGSVLGALILYGAGRWFGERRLRRLVDRYGHLLFLNVRDLDRAEDWFERYGDKAVLLGRIFPTIRSIISIPAGIAAMPLKLFILYTTIGSLAWNSALVVLGWILGENWHLVSHYTRYLNWVIILTMAAVLLWLIWQRWLSPHV